MCIRLSDAAGNITYGKAAPLTRDTVAPIFTSLLGANAAADGLVTNPEASSALALLTLTASGYAAADFTIALDDTPTVTCDVTKTYDQSAIPLINSMGADDSYAVCVKLSDAAANVVYGKSQAILKNSGPPIFTSLVKAAEATDGYVNDSEKSALNALWTLTQSGSVTTSFTVALDDTAGAVVCDASKTYSQSIIARAADIGSDGPRAICVKMDDGAGQITYGKSEQIVRDISAPVFTSLALANAAVDGYVNNSEKLLVSLLYTLSASGQTVTAYTSALSDTGGTLSCDNTQTYSQSTIATPSTLGADGAYALCVRLTDSAGNITYGKSSQLIRDILPPTFSSLNGANAASDLYVKSGEESSNLALYALIGSGYTIDDFTVPLSDNPVAVTCDGTQTYDQSDVPLISTIATDGKFAVCARLTDAAGNNAYGKSQQVTRDILAPAFTSLNGANEASDGFINDSEKTSTLAGWSLSATGQTGANYTVALDDTGGALVCNAARTYSQSSIPSINLISSDGPWAICVKLTDDAGNTSYGKSQQLIRDVGVPVFTSLNGANEASDGYLNSAESSSTSSLLTLSASGYGTAVYTVALDDTPVVTCNGTQTYSQALIPLINSISSDESYAVCVRLTDSAGNIVYGKSQQIIRDTVLPSFTSLVASAEGSDGSINDAEKSATTALWTLTAAGSSSTAYSSALDDTGGALSCNSGVTYGQGTTVARAVDLVSDGAWALCVKLSDSAGNITYGKGDQIVRDTAMPSFTALALANAAADGYISDTEKALATALWTLSASGQSAAAYTLPLDDTGAALTCDGTKTYGQGSIALPSALSTDGPYALCVRLSDAAGNTTYGKSAQVIRDILAPSFTSLNGANGASDLYINASEQNSALAFLVLSASSYTSAAYTFALDDSTPVTCNGTQTYGQSSIPLINSLSSDGTYAVCAKLSDAAGNISYGKSQTIIRATTAPTFTSLIGLGGASDGYINTSESASATAAWTLSASGQTVSAYTLPLDDTSGAVVCNAAKTYGQSSIPLITAMTSDGPWAICVKLSDAAGNITYGKSQQIIRDTAAPSFTSLLGANEASDAYVNLAESASTQALLSLSASGYGVAAYTLALDNTPSATCDVSQTYGQSTVPQIADLSGDDSYAVCVRLTDAAGNITYGKSQSITLDTVPPTFTSLLKTAEGSDGYIKDSEKTASNALWSLTSTGATSIAYSSAVDDTGGGLVCNGGESYNQGPTVATANDITTDGPYALCVRLTDAAGNIAYGKGDQIIRDVAPPTFTSLARANAASDGFINDSEKALATAMWTLTASGQSATAYSLALSDSGGSLVCDVGQTYGQGSIAAPTGLSADGPYALCVRLTDTAGNITYGKSAQVTRDIVAPTFTSLNGINEASNLIIAGGEENSVLALYALTASGQTTTNYTLALSDTGGVLVCDGSKTYSQSSIPTVISIGLDGYYAVCVKLSDAAGNITYGKSQQVYRNVGGPSFTSLLGANAASDAYVNNSEKNSTSAAWALSAASYTGVTYTLPLDDAGGAVVCNASQTYGQGTIPQIDAMMSDGSWAICVRLIDGSSNVTFGKSQTIVRDIIAPSFTSLNGSNGASDGFINGSEAASGAALLSLSASAYDTVMYTIALDDTGAAVTCNGTQTYDQASIPLISDLASDKPFAICALLSDNAGNTTYGKSQQIVRDTIAPTFTSLVKAAEGADGIINDSEKTASNPLWTLTASGQTTTAYSLALDDTGGALACNSGKTYGQGTTVPTAASLASDGAWSLCVKLSDAAGNVTYGKGQQIVRDVAYPVFTSLALANAATDTYVNDSEKLLTSALWTLSASGQTSTDYTVALDDTAGALVCNGAKTYNQASIARPADLSTDGSYALCVRLTDSAGNITYGKSAQLTRDVLAPSLTSLNGANEASDLSIKSGEEAADNALYALVASGYTAVNYTLALDDTAAALVCNSGKTYGQSSIALVSSLSSDGPYALCVKLTDSAGNITYGKSQQVNRDIVAPVFTSLLGANGASDAYVNNSEKASTSVA